VRDTLNGKNPTEYAEQLEKQHGRERANKVARHRVLLWQRKGEPWPGGIVFFQKVVLLLKV